MDFSNSLAIHRWKIFIVKNCVHLIFVRLFFIKAVKNVFMLILQANRDCLSSQNSATTYSFQLKHVNFKKKNIKKTRKKSFICFVSGLERQNIVRTLTNNNSP